MTRQFTPADFGDTGLRHEVNVFVYRYGETEVEYLLLQPQPRHDQVWRPVIGSVDWDEELRHAAARQVQRETGLGWAHDMVVPAPGLVEDVGDLRLVKWPFGYQMSLRGRPLQPSEGVAAWTWCGFEQALHVLDGGMYRQNLLQLHLRLAA